METKTVNKKNKKAADSSTCLHSDNFEINTVKLQGNESVLVDQFWETFFFIFRPKICQTDSIKSCHREWSDVNTTQKYITGKNSAWKYITEKI